MAVRHKLIRKPPDAVWDVLSDSSGYERWVVGPSGSEPAKGRWPQVGSSLAYTVRIGPCTLRNETFVRRCEPPRILELEVDSGRLGTARVAFEVRPWGEDTLLVVDEHPLRGAGAALHNVAADAVLQLRHRAMLDRLARCCENGEG
ncbi:SRPBCC family protein [Streptomyces nitrosporeus]|uniref:SRPBCC family protein n=1 Tax=Streptomyces nitrosporeus TaxID=28894 RepID=A0A5J6FIN2_9ACTN|nr:SRPBCC family protein [Streptomyces nitrosporeus]QEU76192.1 SRPBCC family protein [Streptomyces nitrosporeus]GGZ08586.1 polyketide cyclase [Streptomyces nitrosporeus]